MTSNLAIACFVLSLLLCGCGGNSSNPPAAPASKTSSPPQPLSCASLMTTGTPLTPKCHVTIYVGGDSTNYGADIDMTTNQVQYPGIGNGIAGRVNPTPVQMLQTWADDTYGPGVVGFIDGSIPGSTCPSDVNGTAPSLSPLGTRLAQSPIHLDAVMTNTEINDQYTLGSSATQYASCLTQWMDVVISYGAVPIYMEPNPIARADANFFDPTYGTTALVYNGEMVFTNAGYPVLGNLNAWYTYAAPPNSVPWNILWLSSDMVHPNPAGYTFKASNYWNGSQAANGTTNSLKAVITSLLQGINP